MVQLSRQDVQSVVDNAKNRVIERMVSRQDIQTITDTARDRVMTYMHDLVQIHQQQLFRRSNMQNTQIQRQIVALEARVIAMEQDLKKMTQLLERIANHETQPQHIYLPAQPESAANERGYTEYVYRGA